MIKHAVCILILECRDEVNGTRFLRNYFEHLIDEKNNSLMRQSCFRKIDILEKYIYNYKRGWSSNNDNEPRMY